MRLNAILVLGTLLAGLGLLPPPAGADASAPVAWWVLADLADGSVPDRTGNGHDLALSSAEGETPPSLVEGVGGKQALRWGQHTLRTSPSPLRHPEITVAAWVRLRGRKRHVLAHSLAGHGDAAHGFQLKARWNAVLTLRVAREGESYWLRTENWGFPTGHWAHIAVALTPERAALFVNGVQVAEERPEGGTGWPSGPNYLTLGSHHWRQAHPFSGDIQEVQVFAEVLDEEQVFRVAAAVFE